MKACRLGLISHPFILRLGVLGGLLGVFGLAGPSPLARADQPDIDAQVALLRLNYRWARVPTVEDLALGKTWGCDYRSAEPGSHLTSTFSKVYQFVLGSEGTVRTLHDALTQDYRFTDTALVGVKSWGPKAFGEEHIRVGAQGELLVEFSLPECSGFACLYLYVRTASTDDLREALVGYGECRLN